MSWFDNDIRMVIEWRDCGVANTLCKTELFSEAKQSDYQTGYGLFGWFSSMGGCITMGSGVSNFSNSVGRNWNRVFDHQQWPLTKEVNPRLAKRPLKIKWRLANRGLTSLVKEATGMGSKIDFDKRKLKKSLFFFSEEEIIWISWIFL